jgi:hypothetical protein
LARAPAIAAADIPMLLWAGWDEPGTIGSLELYTALQKSRRRATCERAAARG